MKLDKSRQARLSEYTQQAEDRSTGSMLEAALRWAELGWNVFPLQPRSKEPLLPRAHKRGIKCNGECGKDGHGAWDGTTDPDRIRRWWSQTPKANIGANLGEDKVAFDRDVQHGAADFVSFPQTRRHLSGRGNGNCHLIYRVEPESAASTLQSGTSVLGDGWDIRAGRGSYIVLPPSIHEETELPYREDPTAPQWEHVLTDDELEEIFDEAGAVIPAAVRGAKRGLQLVKPGTGPQRTQLTDLLENPPVRGKGKTNTWLSQVAGHYAKMYRDKEDLYQYHLREAIAKVDTTYEDFEKTSESIWNKEHVEHPEREATRENGYLIGTGTKLLCSVAVRQQENTSMDVDVWGDFDLICRGIAVGEGDERTYWVSLMFDDKEISVTVDSKTLSDSRRLQQWLMTYGASYMPPPGESPKIAPGTRILRYLNSQDPQRVKITPHLGWVEGVGFVTHEGVITEEGDQGRTLGVVADPRLLAKNTAAYTYGFQGTWEEAQRVLREVLTFQDETVTSVYGAWWAACLLKPQFQARTSVFPFFGVESPSESGKTNGYFEQMVQLNGNCRGQTVPTKAVMRDYASANWSGIVWADDLDSLEQFGELLRASTSGGTAAKFDIDSNSVANVQIVAPIMVTGESLGLSSQKALRDRSIVVEVSSPVHRQSLHGNYPQWDDVKDLQAKYPKSQGGLAMLAGWYVQAALAAAPQAEAYLREAKKQRSGRLGDKFAVLRAGAALLDALVGHADPFEGKGEHVRRVERWIVNQEAQGDLEKENSVTQVLIPWALEAFGLVSDGDDVDDDYRLGSSAPVLVREVQNTLESEGGQRVWVRPQSLAMAWAKYKNHRVEDRTESEQAIRQQLLALGSESKVFKVNGRPARYLGLPMDYSRRVLDRWQS